MARDEQHNIFAEETDNPRYADDRFFYKVEKWTKDGTSVDRLLYAGNNLEKARDIFVKAVEHRPHQANDPTAHPPNLSVARGMTHGGAFPADKVSTVTLISSRRGMLRPDVLAYHGAHDLGPKRRPTRPRRKPRLGFP